MCNNEQPQMPPRLFLSIVVAVEDRDLITSAQMSDEMIQQEPVLSGIMMAQVTIELEDAVKALMDQYGEEDSQVFNHYFQEYLKARPGPEVHITDWIAQCP